MRLSRQKREANQTSMNLLVPEKLILELRSLEKIAIETYTPKEEKSGRAKVREFFRDLGLPIASLIVAVVVSIFGYLINSRQADIAKEQADTAKEQASTAKHQSDTAKQQLRSNIIKEFSDSITKLGTNQTDLTRNLEAIKLAQYGEDALPTIKLALGSNDSRIREAMAPVVSYFFNSHDTTRQKVLSELRTYFNTQNAYLRTGVVDCLIEIDKKLTEEEALGFVELIKSKLDSQADYSRPENQKLADKGIVFLVSWPSTDSAEILLQLAANTSDASTRLSALNNLPVVAKSLEVEKRKEIINGMQKLRGTRPPDDFDQLLISAMKKIDSLLH